jgi:hypothetical protein
MNSRDITKTIVQYTDVCPLGLLLPRQYYSIRSTSSSHKIFYRWIQKNNLFQNGYKKIYQAF